MRTLMMIAAMSMIGTGIFCLANGSAAVFTVAFIIGLAICITGALEIFVGIRADFDMSENAISLTKDGIFMLVFGIVVISDRITDDTTAQMLFAMWLTFEGMVAYNRGMLDILHITNEEKIGAGLNVAMLIFGLYMFYNTALFDLTAAMLIGVAMIMLGMKKFRRSFNIEYIRPGFITGNDEKLKEAIEEEKKALAKAKEGIREQKNARRRIEKIRADIAAEQDVLNSAQIRRREREEDDKQREDKYI